MSSRDHILQVPAVVLGLRIVQLVTAIVILGLAAYGIEFWSFDGDDLSLFTALATMIIVVYYLVSTIAVPAMYNYWAVLGLDIFACVFWIISFSLLASEVAQYQIVTYTSSDCLYEFDGVCYKKRSLAALAKRVATTNVYTYRNSMAAASGLGGLEFLLFVATLAITGIYLHRHRAAGGHCMAGGAVGTGAVNHESKPVELQQNNGYNGQQPVYQQQPAVYQQQPVQQQVYQQQPAEPTYQQQPTVYAAQQDQQVASA